MRRNQACHKFCSKFVKVTRTQEFLQLPPEGAAEVLSFSNITHVAEEDVYAAALRWLENDLPDRQADIFKVRALAGERPARPTGRHLQGDSAGWRTTCQTDRPTSSR